MVVTAESDDAPLKRGGAIEYRGCSALLQP
jgi:hypothetical protein